MVLLEAMALGIPVVGTDIGGIPELISPGRTGMLVRTDDPRDLADAMRVLLTDLPLARAMAHAARDQVIAMHAPSVHLAHLTDIYASASEMLERE
jgi:glycosyltransferase involved in cell wall biosynthesis